MYTLLFFYFLLDHIRDPNQASSRMIDHRYLIVSFKNRQKRSTYPLDLEFRGNTIDARHVTFCYSIRNCFHRSYASYAYI